MVIYPRGNTIKEAIKANSRNIEALKSTKNVAPEYRNDLLSQNIEIENKLWDAIKKKPEIGFNVE